MKLSEEKKIQLLDVESKLNEWDFPPQVIVEITSICNMKCIHCNHRILKRKQMVMSDELYTKIIDEIAELSPNTEVWPTFYGEAFVIGDRLFSRLRYARDKGLSHLVLNSNGRVLNRKNNIDNILTSGLKRFILSLDGFTKETFNSIRVGGDRDEIFQAVEKLLKRKEELKLEYPVIQCQFSIMEKNQHEVAEFKEYWEKRGAEVKTRNMLSWTNSGDVVAPNLVYNSDFRIACPWGNNTMAIHSNGNVVACAVDYEGNFVAENVLNKSLKEIWNGEHLSKLRKPHRNHDWENIPKVCKTCPDWQAVGATYHKSNTKSKEGTRPFWFKEEVE